VLAVCTVTLVVRVVSVPTSTISPSNAGLGKVMVHVVGAAPVHIIVEFACVAVVVKAPEPEKVVNA